MRRFFGAVTKATTNVPQGFVSPAYVKVDYATLSATVFRRPCANEYMIPIMSKLILIIVIYPIFIILISKCLILS